MPDIASARPVAGQPIETAWGQQMHDAVEAMIARPARFVPFGAAINNISAQTFTTSDASPVTLALPSIPTDGSVIAVRMQLILAVNPTSQGTLIALLNPGGGSTAYACVVYASPSANYNVSAINDVVTSGANGTEILYSRTISAGTGTWYLRTLGYWTTAP